VVREGPEGGLAVALAGREADLATRMLLRALHLGAVVGEAAPGHSQ
jgi:hypothetical protein